MKILNFKIRCKIKLLLYKVGSEYVDVVYKYLNMIIKKYTNFWGKKVTQLSRKEKKQKTLTIFDFV